MSAPHQPWAELIKLVDALLRDPSWIHRRVETIRFPDSVSIERSVTIDVDVDAVREHARNVGYPATGSIPIPVAHLAKGLVADLDVRDSGGGAKVVLPGVVNDRVAVGIILGSMTEPQRQAVERNPSIEAVIRDAVRSLPSPQDRQALSPWRSDGDQPRVAKWTLRHDDEDTVTASNTWTEMVRDNPDLWRWLTNFTLNHMLMTVVTEASGTEIIKLRYRDGWDLELTVLERLGIVPVDTFVECREISRAAHTHVQVEAPPGMLVESGFLADPAQFAANPATPDQEYRRRIVPERAAFSTPCLRPGNYVAFVGIRPRRTGFLRAAFLCALATFVLLAAGTWWEHAYRTFTSASEQFDSEAAVAILLVVPTVMSAYVAREGEHAWLSRILRVPRLLLALSGFAALLCGAAIIVGIHHGPLQWVWGVAAAVSLVALLVAGNSMYWSGRALRRVCRFMERTSTGSV